MAEEMAVNALLTEEVMAFFERYRAEFRQGPLGGFYVASSGAVQALNRPSY